MNTAAGPDPELVSKSKVSSSNIVGAISRHLDLRRQGVLIVIALVAILFEFTTNGIFLGPRNIATLLRQASVVGTAACGMTLIIVLGEIDLSIGSIVYLVGVLAAVANIWWEWSLIPTLLITALGAIAIGWWQGTWVARLGVPAFVVTLAGLMGFRGVGLIISDAVTIYPVEPAYQTISQAGIKPPISYILLGAIFLVFVAFAIRGYQTSRRYGIEASVAWTVTQIAIVGAICFIFAAVTAAFEGIPAAVIVVFAVAVAMQFLMRNTVLGRNIYAIGSNKDAAALAGINVKRHIVYSFVVMGVIYFVSGTLLTARMSGSVTGMGQGMELEAIAATVIGGTSLMGGVGSISGALAGALLLAAVDNGMSLMNLSSFYQLVAKAALLLLAVAFDVATRRRTG